MYLSRFGVKNYKCLGEIDIPLTPIHVLIGENDAGKTSLLEAMAAFFASSDRDLCSIFPEPWDGRELVLHESRNPRIELWGELEDTASESDELAGPIFRYGIAVDFPKKGRNCGLSGDWIEQQGKRQELSSARQQTTVKLFKQGHNIRKDIRQEADMISNVLKPAHKYGLNPKLMAIPAVIDPARMFRLDPDGFGLPTLLGDISDYEPELSIHLRKEFCSFFPQFRNVRVESEDALQRRYTPDGMHTFGTGAGKGIYFETQSGEKIRARQASDGAILFLGFLALAHLPDPPKLLLIEEPENGIYPKRLGEVIELLKELVNRTEGVRFPQIIMSTHSPYVLSLFEPEEVTFLSRPPDNPDGPVRARPLRDAKNIKERMADGFYLGELWYNLSEEDLFGES